MFWFFSHEDDEIMTDVFFHEGTGLYSVTGSTASFTSPPAKPWLMVYRRRVVLSAKISDLIMTFRFYFCDFFGAVNLLWIDFFPFQINI